MELHLRAMGLVRCHLTYEVTQCYLPTNTSEHIAPYLTPARQAGTQCNTNNYES